MARLCLALGKLTNQRYYDNCGSSVASPVYTGLHLDESMKSSNKEEVLSENCKKGSSLVKLRGFAHGRE